MTYYSNGSRYGQNAAFGNRKNLNWGGILVALLVAGFSICKYYSSSEVNDVTGEKQHIGTITKDQEITLGLESAPAMAQEYGGLYPDERAQAYVKQVGHRIEQNSAVQTSGYQYDFHLLADPNVVNAFALPGGQVFITKALFSRLQNEDQLAGIFGHEISHVVARHGSQQMAKQELIQGVTGAAVIAAGDYSSTQGIQMIANMIGMKYGRDQETQADELGVRFMIEAGYDARALIDVMHILEEASGGGQRQPEYLSTHPNPENRIEKIKIAIEKYSKTTTPGQAKQLNGEPVIRLKNPNLNLK
ncbi:MAG: M48 family metalloprotease [Saprospiraceae bacterium]